jgi:NAD-dependent dihydropyrimidine dehydrogenase PreA subunit
MIENIIEMMATMTGVFWFSISLGHFVSKEDSELRKIFLMIFARYLEVPILYTIWLLCEGPLKFILNIPGVKTVMGTLVTRPFGNYMDTGVPIPTKDILKLVDKIDGRIAVGDCRCRLAKNTCDCEMRADITIRTGADAWLWAFPDNYTEISKDEVKEIILKCSDQDMFQMVFIHCSTANDINEYVICNCCSCGCKVHLLNRTMGQEYFPLRDGGFRSFHDPNKKCEQCGACVEKCPFDAIKLVNEKIEITDCFGCGICERVCENNAYEVKQTKPGPEWSNEAWRMIGEV